MNGKVRRDYFKVRYRCRPRARKSWPAPARRKKNAGFCSQGGRTYGMLTWMIILINLRSPGGTEKLKIELFKVNPLMNDSSGVGVKPCSPSLGLSVT